MYNQHQRIEKPHTDSRSDKFSREILKVAGPARASRR
jgi:hypothetical protein